MFTGNGRASTRYFWLDQGTATFHVTYGGTGRIEVTLWDGQSRGDVKVLVDTTGKFDKSIQVTVVRADRYLLDANIDGDWTILVSQP
jgi:hypothetical protein